MASYRTHTALQKKWSSLEQNPTDLNPGGFPLGRILIHSGKNPDGTTNKFTPSARLAFGSPSKNWFVLQKPRQS